MKIKSVSLRNRIVMSPMCQYSSQNGFANDWHLAHYAGRAAGGCALIMQEATAVEPEGRITPGDLGLWSDEHIPVLEKIVAALHNQGAVAGIQLAHAGRKASCSLPWEGGKQLELTQGGWTTKAPSAIPFSGGERLPHALEKNGISRIAVLFREAALRALKAGFRVVEIHSAHGYLLQEFLSPLSNQRTDEYGGVFENRIRLLMEVIKEVKVVWPEENPLFVRISSTDWSEGGWTPDESVKLAGILKTKGVDLLDCSAGGNIANAKIPFGPGFMVPFSEMIRKTGILTGTVGFITNAVQAESILEQGKADLIFIGRELLRNPYFALQAARELGVEADWPKQYLRAK